MLWQGRPNALPFVTPGQVGRMLRVLIAVVLLVYVLARLGYGLPPLTDIRVIAILIVFQAVPLEILQSAVKRRWSRYALTDQRAMIVVDWPVWGCKLQSYPLAATTPLEFVKGRRLSSVYFASPKRAFWDLRGGALKVGFERIRDGKEVFAMITKMQSGAV